MTKKKKAINGVAEPNLFGFAMPEKRIQFLSWPAKEQEAAIEEEEPGIGAVEGHGLMLMHDRLDWGIGDNEVRYLALQVLRLRDAAERQESSLTAEEVNNLLQVKARLKTGLEDLDFIRELLEESGRKAVARYLTRTINLLQTAHHIACVRLYGLTGGLEGTPTPEAPNAEEE